MISISKFKELLGQEGFTMADQEVEDLLEVQYYLANITFDIWQKENLLSKEQLSPD